MPRSTRISKPAATAASPGGTAAPAGPLFAVRRLSAIYSRGKLTVELGKQFVRWGKTDVLNPTDRFAPRDFLNVVDSDFLGITAARVTYGTQSDTIDVVFEPRLTPSRVPLLNQRWAVLPAGIPIAEQPADFPGGPQFGARWNHIGSAAEYSLFLLQRLRQPAALSRPAPTGAPGRRSHALLSADADVRRRPRDSAAARDGEGRSRILHVLHPRGGSLRALGAAARTTGRRVEFRRRLRGAGHHGARHGCLVLPRPRRYPGRGGARRIHHRHQPLPWISKP